MTSDPHQTADVSGPWFETARQNAQNADYWHGRTTAAEQRVMELEAAGRGLWNPRSRWPYCWWRMTWSRARKRGIRHARS